MDFFNMNFSTLFSEKHGKQEFDNISEQILREKPLTNNNNYTEVVFKVAFLDFFGLDDSTIEKMIKDIMKFPNVNIAEIKSVHKASISEIQKYLKSAMEDTL